MGKVYPPRGLPCESGSTTGIVRLKHVRMHPALRLHCQIDSPRYSASTLDLQTPMMQAWTENN